MGDVLPLLRINQRADGERRGDGDRYPVIPWMSAHSSMLYLENDELQALAMKHWPVIALR